MGRAASLLVAAALVGTGCVTPRSAPSRPGASGFDYHYSRVAVRTDLPPAAAFARLDASASAASIRSVPDSSATGRRVYRSAEGDLVVTLAPDSAGAVGQVELREHRDHERAAWNRWLDVIRARHGEAFLQQRPVPIWRSAAPDACTSEVSATEPTPGLAMAEKLSGTDPAYPERLRRAGIESRAVVEAVLSREGRVVCINGWVLSTPQAMANVVGAVRSWPFRPFTVNGVPVQAPLVIPFRFKLE